MGWYGMDDEWPDYVPVYRRVAAARRHAEQRAEQSGRQAEPVRISGREIVKTFWGKAWCRNLENYSDFSNRLPRGRTYARNGSVADVHVTQGLVEAVVAGSYAYDVRIEIKPLAASTWRAIKRDCATSIGSLLDLLAGRLADDVMRRLTQPDDGMFPSPRQIALRCSCPDGARLCKHLAAVLYAIGHRLDTQPELLFLLRGVDQQELVSAATRESVSQAVRGQVVSELAEDDLGDIFGIDLGAAAAAKKKAATKKRSTKKVSVPKAKASKKATKKKAQQPAVKKAAQKKAAKKTATKKGGKKAAAKTGRKAAPAKASVKKRKQPRR